MSTASGDGTTPPLNIMHEVWEFSQSNDRQFGSFATVFENFEEAQRKRLEQLKASSERAQAELNGARKVISDVQAARVQAEQERDSIRLAFQRVQYERDTKLGEVDQLQQHYRVTRDELQRVQAELDETKARLATAQASRLNAENDNTLLKGEVDRLQGVVSDQQADLTNLQTAHVMFRRKFRRGAAVAVAVIVLSVVAAGISTWMSWAQALAR